MRRKKKTIEKVGLATNILCERTHTHEHTLKVRQKSFTIRASKTAVYQDI